MSVRGRRFKEPRSSGRFMYIFYQLQTGEVRACNSSEEKIERVQEEGLRERQNGVFERPKCAVL
jgi:hypothetical protein